MEALALQQFSNMTPPAPHGKSTFKFEATLIKNKKQFSFYLS